MKVLVVEDDAKLATTLKQTCQEAGYGADVARSGAQARVLLGKDAYDVVILDLGLPDEDGLDVLRFVRSLTQRMAVLILTARGSVEDRVKGLDQGADDYLVKPFAVAELMARLSALQRRRTQDRKAVLTVADLTVDVLGRRVTRGGRTIELTPKEFDVLVYLIRSGGTVVSREMIARDVWKITSRATPIDNVIDVHVSRLRRKIDATGEDLLIRNVRGVGFALGESE